MPRVPKSKLRLWWCQTADHDEDWFVVDRTQAGAEEFFRLHEGYHEGDVWAERLGLLPDEYQEEALQGWPDHELLEACGGRVLRVETPRVVELEGRRYVEGMLESLILEKTDDLFEAQNGTRPNKTRPTGIC